jgi:hypothetical protein
MTTPETYNPDWLAPSWEACPGCGHLGIHHDLYAPDRPDPSCCVDGCGCGPQNECVVCGGNGTIRTLADGAYTKDPCPVCSEEG